MTPDDVMTATAVLAVAMPIAAFLVGFRVGSGKERADAVRAGAAGWEVDDGTGEARFRYGTTDGEDAP